MERFWDLEQNESVRCPHFRKMMALLACGPHMELLYGLSNGSEASVSDLAQRLHLHVDSTSAGLRKLRQLGLLTVRREKKHHFYRLSRGFRVVLVNEILEIEVANLDGSIVLLRVPRNRVSLPV